VTAVATETAFRAGVYDGMPEDMYHADPVPGGSLSSSGARKLLPPSCPAKFRYEASNPPPPKDHLELGSAAHKMVLGAGAEIVVIKAKDWRTRAAQDERDAARAEGFLPLLTAEHQQVQAMAAALRAHPIASALFNPERGKPEQSLFWQDPETGVWRRSRFDWLPDLTARERLIITDYKTSASADPRAFAKSAANYGYHQQDAWYRDAARALGLSADPAFVFVIQEKEPPYLVTVAELDGDAIRAGRDLNRIAIEIYRDCAEAGDWPGYSAGIELISLPAWAYRRLEEY
jgi:PDDEXK-like domain of unknown function (DUF3799)